MKPKQIRIIQNLSPALTSNKVYDVLSWEGGLKEFPKVLADTDRGITIMDSKWEPVFQAGEAVWAWDNDVNKRRKGFYIGKSKYDKNYPHVVDVIDGEYLEKFQNISCREEKPKITIEELAEKAGIDLEDYEVVE